LTSTAASGDRAKSGFSRRLENVAFEIRCAAETHQAERWVTDALDLARKVPLRAQVRVGDETRLLEEPTHHANV
jgi:hypothetical protein